MFRSLKSRILAKSMLDKLCQLSTRQVETYYDILQVKKDSTNREIRSAFVQLSKKFHPDTKGVEVDPQETAKFVKISEAYQTLSKPTRRIAYDQQLWAKGIWGQDVTSSTGDVGDVPTAADFHKPWDIHPQYDPNPGPYYGIDGVDKVSNSKVVSLLIALSLLGIAFGFVSVKQSFDFNRHLLDKKSSEASNHHENVRSDARKFGNDEQLRRMMNRMVRDET